MPLSAAERNRRKRKRKKKDKQEHGEGPTDAEFHGRKAITTNAPEVEIEYVAAPLTTNESDGPLESLREMESVLRKFEERAVVVTDDDMKEAAAVTARDDDSHEDYDEENISKISKRKLREIVRPSLADLKRRVKRPDLVEAHDVTAF